MRNLFRRRYLPTHIILLFLFGSASLHAHEFWLEPKDFTLEAGEPLLAEIKVGQELAGNKYSFIPKDFERFDLIQDGQTQPVKSRMGDRPPVNEKNLKDGLLILAYESTMRSLRYTDPEKFQNFLVYEGIEWVEERHLKRGLPAKGFVEIYRRYGKSLVKSGTGKGNDQPVGLPFELILLNNPYTENEPSIKVQLLWQGKPFANAQISVFFKTDSPTDQQVTRTLHHTDQQGKAVIPRPVENGMMLLNAVHMIEPDAKTLLETGALWESLWASTTFAIENNENE